jgi:hypothetical protein
MFANHGDIQFDVFYHLWSFNSGRALSNTPVPSEEFEELDALINPVAKIVEGPEVSPRDMVSARLASVFPERKIEDVAAIWTAGQFYSTMRVAELKRAYEREHGFLYDACVKIRTDIKFKDSSVDIVKEYPRPQSNTVYSIHSHWDDYMRKYRLGDILYYADSPSFDRMAWFFRFMHCIPNSYINPDEKVPSEYAFFFYSKMVNMNVFALKADVDFIRQPGILPPRPRSPHDRLRAFLTGRTSS